MSEKMSFEQALTKLEEIVKQLETGGVELDASIKLFEQGVALAEVCKNEIESAKLKVKEASEINETEANNE